MSGRADAYLLLSSFPLGSERRRSHGDDVANSEIILLLCQAKPTRSLLPAEKKASERASLIFSPLDVFLRDVKLKRDSSVSRPFFKLLFLGLIVLTVYVPYVYCDCMYLYYAS